MYSRITSFTSGFILMRLEETPFQNYLDKKSTRLKKIKKFAGNGRNVVCSRFGDQFLENDAQLFSLSRLDIEERTLAMSTLKTPCSGQFTLSTHSIYQIISKPFHRHSNALSLERYLLYLFID